MVGSNSVKGHCPECGPNRNADVIADHKFAITPDEEHDFTHYFILRCRGCDTGYIQMIEDIFGMDSVDYWPIPTKRRRPKWAFSLTIKDATLGTLFGHVYKAFDNGLNVLAAIGIRTAFDRASELLGVDPDQTFAQKLEALCDSGRIGESEKDVLAVLIDAGGAAAHRAWSPSDAQVHTMLDTIEPLLYRSFVQDEYIAELKSTVPARKGKKP